MAVVLTQLSVGFTIAGGTTSKLLTVSDDANVSGTNSGNVTLSGENYLSLSGQAITANAVNLSGSNATGTLAAGRFPALTGDVTTAAGSLATTIANNAVTDTKMATSTANTLAGYDNSGDFGDVAIGSGLDLSSGTLSSTAGFSPMPTTVTTGTSASMSVNNAYVSNHSTTPVTFTLPSTFSVGDEFIVMGLGTGGWIIAQNASQLIHLGTQVTTTGTGGDIKSANQYDIVHLKAVVADTTLIALSWQGSPLVQ